MVSGRGRLAWEIERACLYGVHKAGIFRGHDVPRQIQCGL